MTDFMGGVHLFLGSDRVGKFRRIHELEHALGVQPMDHHHVDAAAISSGELLALYRQQPALSAVRLIVVEQAHRLDRACLDALLKRAAGEGPHACLVLLVESELNVRHPLLTAGEAIALERFPGRDVPSAKPFAMTDALGAHETGAALAALQDQLMAGREPLELLGLMAWQLQRWVTVKRLQRLGYTAEAIASAIHVRVWQAQRLQTEVAHRSLASLQRVLARCWQLDVDAKRGRAIPGLAIEQLVIEVCLPTTAKL